MNVDDLLKEIQIQLSEKNVNFLIGSGASVPFFPSLGNIEKVLTERENSNYVRQLIYLHYFNKVIVKNYDLIDNSVYSEFGVTKNYRSFIKGLVNTMNYRNTRVSPKRVNIFTTNYDLFFERAIDFEQRSNSSLIINDGTNGYFLRTLSSENYHKTVSRNGVFDNYQKELPTINLIKCHGSVNWVKTKTESEDVIAIENDLKLIEKVRNEARKIKLTEEEEKYIEEYLSKEEIDEDLNIKINDIAEINWWQLETFFSEYKKLMIINPEKSKFQNTVLDEHYYSLLRLLSYELEKEQTVLIVFGFSFADEHIRNLIKRSFHNPQLRIYIFVYQNGMRQKMTQLLNCDYQKNVVIIEPTDDMPPIDLSFFNKLLFEGNEQ